MQERVASDRTEKYIVHKPTDVFIINMHALHNSHLIRTVLPRELVHPSPFMLDRLAHRHRVLPILQEKMAATSKKKRKDVSDNSGDGQAPGKRLKKKRADEVNALASIDSGDIGAFAGVSSDVAAQSLDNGLGRIH